METSYKFSVVKTEKRNDFTAYLIKVVVVPFNISFHIRDRFSGLQNWQNLVRNSLQNDAGLASFPPKKWFGNDDPEFIKKRSQDIEMFLNMFLKHPEVIKSNRVVVYFKEQAVEKIDVQAIEDLTMSLIGKKPK